MSERQPATEKRTTDTETLRIDLGEIEPGGSRQAGRRSGVTLTAAGVIAGLANGCVRAFDDGGRER